MDLCECAQCVWCIDLHVYVVCGWVGCMDLCECAQCVWCIDLHVYVVCGWVGVWIYVSVPSVGRLLGV